MLEKKDELEENFDKIIEDIKVIGIPKSLIKDGEFQTRFKANGTDYQVFAPSDVFNFNRQIAYQQIETALALNQTPQQIATQVGKLYSNQVRLMGNTGGDWAKMQDENLRDCINFVDAIKGNTEDSNFCNLRRLPKAYYLCTLFIIKEGEDLKAWSPKLAHEKIDDWIKENLNPFDFFSLALHSSIACQEIMKTDYTDL
jgi:hypothetical protein|tara:strand:+ start:71 stop:667 length:597 start_codon:yes stop_codon:yes gene_type:complete